MDINYQKLINDAMLGVVKKLLKKITPSEQKSGHHFYINFLTFDPLVVLSPKLRAQYPDSMCIVLQHEFYDLTVYEDKFSVSLSFDGVQETITVPFRAIIDFTDPFANFRLEFPLSTSLRNADDDQYLDDYQKYIRKQQEISPNLIKARKARIEKGTAEPIEKGSSKLDKIKNMKIEKSDNIISLDFKNKKH